MFLPERTHCHRRPPHYFYQHGPSRTRCHRPPHYLYHICTITDQHRPERTCRHRPPTMTPPTRPPSTAEAANNDNNTLISDYFK